MNKVKCTYPDCFRHFASSEAMIRHKIKEPNHFYCKRCDVDSKDDMAHLIHQIQSPKHICCPVCGAEFQSTGGRDLHVETSHPAKQDLQCVGCEARFTRASLLMSHFEKNECEIITLEHFERRRAEKQVQKDAWNNVLNSNKASLLSSGGIGSDQETNGGGVTLLDSHHGYSTEWQDNLNTNNAATVLQPTSSASGYRAPRPPVEGLSRLSLDKFPPLAPTNVPPRSSTNKNENAQSATNGDLLSFDQPEERISQQAPGSGAWGASQAEKKKVFTFDHSASHPPTLLSEVGAPSNITRQTAATYGSTSTTSRRADQLTQLSAAQKALDQSTVPPSLRPPQDPTTQSSKITTIKSIPISSNNIDANQFYSPIVQKIVCPAPKCNRHFDTVEAFHAHLTTGAHVGGRTTCPCCLRHFGSTAALIAHCESANRRCNIRKTTNYNQIMRELTGGLIGTEGFLVDGSVRYRANEVHEW